MQWLDSYGYAGMFVASLLSATLLPLGSEAVLSALFYSGYALTGLVIVASVGNTLGSIVNYWLGWRFGEAFCMRWLGIKPATFEKAMTMNKRWGNYALLFAWLPVIGDPLTALAGTLKTRFATFLVLVALGKSVRYIALASLLY